MTKMIYNSAFSFNGSLPILNYKSIFNKNARKHIKLFGFKKYYFNFGNGP